MAGAVFVIAATVALSLLHSRGASSPTVSVAPVQGLACPNLLQASSAYARGDRVTFTEQIARAATIAEQMLQTSGQEFGRPERIALELHLAPDQPPSEIERMLQQAVEDCQRV